MGSGPLGVPFQSHSRIVVGLGVSIPRETAAFEKREDVVVVQCVECRKKARVMSMSAFGGTYGRVRFLREWRKRKRTRLETCSAEDLSCLSKTHMFADIFENCIDCDR
jgi:ssDNA-binding Zn-finger/Zn-ribbon topoisomerase 1